MTVSRCKKLIAVVVLGLVLTTGFLVGCGNGSSSPAKDTIKIGFQGILTGDSADYGEGAWNGAMIAVNEINQAGGLLGKQVELVKEDDRGDSKEAAAVAKKLAENPDIVAVLGPLFSYLAMASCPIYQEAGVPSLIIGASSPAITSNGDTVFQTALNDKVSGELIAHYVVEQLGFKSIAIIRENSDMPQYIANAFSDTAASLGATVTGTALYTGGVDKDFRAMLTTLNQSKPEALFMIGYPTECALIMKQAKDIAMSAQLVGADIATQQLLEIAGSAADGSVLIAYFSPEVPDQAVKDFAAKYAQLYDKPVHHYAPQAYDAMKVLAAAIEKAGKPDRAAVREALTSTDYQGITGPLKFNADRQRIAGWQAVIKVEGGKFNVLEVAKIGY